MQRSFAQLENLDNQKTETAKQYFIKWCIIGHALYQLTLVFNSKYRSDRKRNMIKFEKKHKRFKLSKQDYISQPSNFDTVCWKTKKEIKFSFDNHNKKNYSSLNLSDRLPEYLNDNISDDLNNDRNNYVNNYCLNKSNENLNDNNDSDNDNDCNDRIKLEPSCDSGMRRNMNSGSGSSSGRNKRRRNRSRLSGSRDTSNSASEEDSDLTMTGQRYSNSYSNSYSHRNSHSLSQRRVSDDEKKDNNNNNNNNRNNNDDSDNYSDDDTDNIGEFLTRYTPPRSRSRSRSPPNSMDYNCNENDNLDCNLNSNCNKNVDHKNLQEFLVYHIRNRLLTPEQISVRARTYGQLKKYIFVFKNRSFLAAICQIKKKVTCNLDEIIQWYKESLKNIETVCNQRSWQIPDSLKQQIDILKDYYQFHNNNINNFQQFDFEIDSDFDEINNGENVMQGIIGPQSSSDGESENENNNENNDNDENTDIHQQCKEKIAKLKKELRECKQQLSNLRRDFKIVTTKKNKKLTNLEIEKRNLQKLLKQKDEEIDRLKKQSGYIAYIHDKHKKYKKAYSRSSIRYQTPPVVDIDGCNFKYNYGCVAINDDNASQFTTRATIDTQDIANASDISETTEMSYASNSTSNSNSSNSLIDNYSQCYDELQQLLRASTPHNNATLHSYSYDNNGMNTNANANANLNADASINTNVNGYGYHYIQTNKTNKTNNRQSRYIRKNTKSRNTKSTNNKRSLIMPSGEPNPAKRQRKLKSSKKKRMQT